jgi:acetyl-CoA carboxylase biotin carboxyl carrier protein
MNLKEIKEIIALMNENDLNEIEIDRDGLKLKLKKSKGDAPAVMMPASVPYSLEKIPAPQITREQAAAGGEAPRKNSSEIKSPMVGTFYKSPSPEAPAFVEVGQTVEVGQVVCIVEAMKLMNEIKSEVRGKVVEVVVENAEPVEFGQTLFVVEPL